MGFYTLTAVFLDLVSSQAPIFVCASSCIFCCVTWHFWCELAILCVCVFVCMQRSVVVVSKVRLQDVSSPLAIPSPTTTT